MTRRTASSQKSQRTLPPASGSSPEAPTSSHDLTTQTARPLPTRLTTSAEGTRCNHDDEATTGFDSQSDSMDLDLSNNIYFDLWMQSTMQAYRKFSPLAQPNHPFTVFSALYINGELQGIPCATTYSARTPSPTPSIPLPLHPTEMQLMIVHPRWIDRLPFPRMRDSLIKLRGVVDEEEILKDIFTMPSWTITPGQACWDPRAWKMEKEWAGKWGWLMV